MKLLSLIALALSVSAIFSTAAGKPHAAVIVGTHHYSPQLTMPKFAAELERLGFEVTLINPDWDPEKDARGLPGLDALDKADVGVFFVRFLKLGAKQLGHIKKFVESGKPAVCFRTSTHAFNYPAAHPERSLNRSFGREVFGTPYLIHLQGQTQIEFAENADKHPVLTGVENSAWASPGTLYLTKLGPGAMPLLSGTGQTTKPGVRKNQFGTHTLEKQMTDTIAWTWENQWGGRVFGTSLGHAGDFAAPQSMRVMVNGVFWAAGQPVPTAGTAIQTFATKVPAKKKKRVRRTPRPQPKVEPEWKIATEAQWQANIGSSVGIKFGKAGVSPAEKSGSVRTKIRTFKSKRSAKSLTVRQSPIWQNWNPIENLGPSNLSDAPVMLTMGEDNYWMFGRYGGGQPRRKKGDKRPPPPPFKPEPATLEGFDVPLKTTRFPNQFDAPGGLKPRLGGYHAWQSRDMKTWVHHGPVTERFSCWVTSAEQKDGNTYIIYDYPNDQDPHLYIDRDLTDGEPGENKGLVLADPSHGSDSGLIRDAEGKFHIIFENWDHINASKRAWDSPVAGHAVSDDCVNDFKILKPAVDVRTKPTGVKKTYRHPHWLQHPDWDTNIAEYEVHEPEQGAHGDWAAICVGGQYYLFGDYDPAGGHQMSVGWFTSPSLDQPFTWCDNIGKGHPDPDIAFAEGQFYLVTQQKTDYVSPGPWVEKVTARVGTDTDNDAKIDHWSDWTELGESYDYTPGFSKQIARTPARLDLSKLPAGFGFQIEFRLEDTTENRSKPIVESITLAFDAD